MISAKQRQQVYHRSHHACEAVIEADNVRLRCGVGNSVEVHHMLTRSRGGNALDRAGETYHLLVLCREHHQLADGAAAYEGGLLIDGYASWDDTLDRPVYTGSDPYLSHTYPQGPRCRV